MRSLFERMADAQRMRDEEAEAIRSARPGDVVPAGPPKLDIRPAFTGAGAPTFRPARHAKRPAGK